MAKQALEGLKVVDFGWAIAGPAIAVWLAHHGATVIHIESIKRLDIARAQLPYKDGIPGVNRAGTFPIFNSNKLGVTLNLSQPKAIEVAKRIIAWSDIVTENFSPGVMERLGLGYEELRKLKPDIIMCSTSNLGQTGPEARQPGYGAHLVGYSGFTYLTGWPDREPTPPQGSYTDFIAPRFGAAAVLAAFDYHRRTGKGQNLDLSQMEAGAQFIAPAILDYTVNKRIETRDGNRCPYAAPHGAYPCRGDDRWCAIAVFSDKEWDALCRTMGNPKWTGERKFATLSGRKVNEEELDGRVGEWTRNLNAEEVMERLQAAGVPAGIVKNVADVQDDPQLAYRHYFWQLEHTELGTHYCEGIGGCILSKTPEDINMSAPLLGQHTQFVCQEILGMSDEEFVELSNQGVFE